MIGDAAHAVLRGIETGSITPVLELPGIESDQDRQQGLEVDVAHLGELAAAQILDVVSEEIDGHPYVVEALSDLTTKLQIGDRYDSVGFELTDSAVPRSGVTLDIAGSRRLRERVKVDKAAARQGMLVGTLVEADFESYTARLRSPEGQPVAVSFDPAMADAIHEGLSINDMWTAACALSYGLPIVTNNLSDFQSIQAEFSDLVLGHPDI